MQKFSDDTAIVGCIKDGQEGEYRSLVEDFVGWCRTNQLQLNTTKTKEMVVDFRMLATPVLPVTVDGVNVETVSTYKYLGLHLDNKLDWSANTDVLYKKGQSRLYFLRRLGSFNVCSRFLLMFLSVCHGQCPFLCSRMLGRQHKEEGCWTTGQAGEKSWLCGGHGAGVTGRSCR